MEYLWKNSKDVVGARRLQDQKLNIEHTEWKTRLKTLENFTEVLVKINGPQI